MAEDDALLDPIDPALFGIKAIVTKANEASASRVANPGGAKIYRHLPRKPLLYERFIVLQPDFAKPN